MGTWRGRQQSDRTLADGHSAASATSDSARRGRSTPPLTQPARRPPAAECRLYQSHCRNGELSARSAGWDAGLLGRLGWDPCAPLRYTGAVGPDPCGPFVTLCHCPLSLPFVTALLSPFVTALCHCPLSLPFVTALCHCLSLDFDCLFHCLSHCLSCLFHCPSCLFHCLSLDSD